MKAHFPAAAAALLAVLAGAARADEPPAGGAAPVFESDILPIFKRRCTGCHGGEKQRARLRLDGIERILAGGKNGPAIVRGKSGGSLILRRLRAEGDERMPPEEAGKPLSAGEIARIAAWIDGGARSLRPDAEPAGGRDPAPPALSVKAARGVRSPAASIAFSPDGKFLAIGAHREALAVDPASGRIARRLGGHAGLVRAAAFSPDGAVLAAAGGLPARRGEVLLWNFPGFDLRGRIEGHADAIHSVAFSPDGSRLVTSSYDRLVKVWEAETGRELATLKDHIDAVHAAAFSPDGRRIASAAADRTLKIWDAASGDRLTTLSEATDGLLALAFHPGGGRIAAAGADSMLRVWRLSEAGGELLKSSFAHDGSILKVIYSNDGNSIYTAASDRRVKRWDAAALTETRVYEEQPDWPMGLALDAAGELLAVSRYDGGWTVYRAADGEVVSRGAVDQSGQIEKKDPEGAKGGVPVAGEELFVRPVHGGSVTVPPFITGWRPRGAAVAPGGAPREVTLTIDGRNLAGAELLFYEPGIKAEVLANESGEPERFRPDNRSTAAQISDPSIPGKLTVKLAIAPGTRGGIHRFAARTPLGVTNSQPFFIETLPEVEEKEPNDQAGAAQRIEFPAAVRGAMNRSGDADRFRFEARAGQELVFRIVASAIGSGLNARLALHDAAGNRIASSDDPGQSGGARDARLGHRFESDGEYELLLEDRQYAAGGFYWLEAGEFPLVVEAFPPGLQKGTAAEIAVRGFNLGGEKIAVTAPAEVGWGHVMALPIPAAVIARHGPPIDAGRIAVGEEPEFIEDELEGGSNDSPAGAQELPVPATVNGRIHRAAAGESGAGAADRDLFRFRARSGQTLLVEVNAQRLGSPLDSRLEILRPDGRPLERAVLRPVAQSVTTLSDRDARSLGIRIVSWVDFRLNDFLMIGSEVVRIETLPDYADEDVVFFGIGGSRRGYLDTTPEFHAVGQPVYKVEIHPPGARFPSNGMPLFRLHTANDDGQAPGYGRDALIRFEPPEDGEYLAAIADARGFEGPRFDYRLTIREPRPDFRFSAGPGHIAVASGGRVPITARVERLDGFEGEIAVRALDVPEGFRVISLPILAGEESAELILEAGPGAHSTPFLEGAVRLEARARIGEREVVREARTSDITVLPPADIVLDIEPREIVLEPGGRVEVTVAVRRQNGFERRVPLEVPNLPHGVYVMDTGLNGILVTEKDDSRAFIIYAEPWVRPIERTVFATGRVETRSPVPSVHASPPATLVIGRSGGREASF